MFGINTCEHDNCVIVYKESVCPFCKQEEETSDLKEEIEQLKNDLQNKEDDVSNLESTIKSLEKENNDLVSRLEIKE